MLARSVSCLLVMTLHLPTAIAAERVIHISVDGLYAGAIQILGPSQLPNFFRLSAEGASTLAARTDTDFTNTLPNHASQLTGRPVSAAGGHGWSINFDPGAPVTLHTAANQYIAGVFDQVHDAGKSTALFAGKKKFAVFDRGWNEQYGALDSTGADNGRDKIDRYVYHSETATLVSEFIADLQATPRHYTFLHIRDPDSAGHGSGWNWAPDSPYMQSIIGVDTYLGSIIAVVEADNNYRGKTAIILTSDHGGQQNEPSHTPDAPESHRVPFYVWGAGVAPNQSLYQLNRCTAQKPSLGINPAYTASLQPIRNGDAANLAMRLLNLPLIFGSTIKTIKNLSPTSSNQKCVSAHPWIPLLLLLS